MRTQINQDAEVVHHYLVEKELAGRLMGASKLERRDLYTKLYDELFQRVPQHPMLVQKGLKDFRQMAVSEHLRLIGPYLGASTRFMEVGPGDCALSFEVASSVGEVIAIDVSNEITRNVTFPANFKLILSDGLSIPVPECSIDFAFSNQLMEHLHPDDALEQLKKIVRSLAVNGTYMCITPNRLSGPHDVSKYFDDVATGFHLKEYTTQELLRLFLLAWLTDLKLIIRIKGRYLFLPNWVFIFAERIVSRTPVRQRRRICSSFPLRTIMSCIYIVGYKREGKQ